MTPYLLFDLREVQQLQLWQPMDHIQPAWSTNTNAALFFTINVAHVIVENRTSCPPPNKSHLQPLLVFVVQGIFAWYGPIISLFANRVVQQAKPRQVGE